MENIYSAEWRTLVHRSPQSFQNKRVGSRGGEEGKNNPILLEGEISRIKNNMEILTTNMVLYLLWFIFVFRSY